MSAATSEYVSGLLGIHELNGLYVGIASTRRDRMGMTNRFVKADDTKTIVSTIAALDADPDSTGVFMQQTLGDHVPGKGHRFNARDAVAMINFWAEIDFGKPGAPSTLADALKVVDAIGLPPTLIKLSGHGIHLEWRLAEVWRFESEAERVEAADLEMDLVRTISLRAHEVGGWDIDSVFDFARVMRVPGSTNRKVPGEELPCTILRHEPNRAYEMQDLREILVERRFLDARTKGDGITDAEQREILGRLGSLSTLWEEAQRGGAADRIAILREYVEQGEDFRKAPELIAAWDAAAKDTGQDSENDLSLATRAYWMFRDSDSEDDNRDAARMAALFVMGNRVRTKRGIEKVDPARRTDYVLRTVALACKEKPRPGRAEPMTLEQMKAAVTALAEPPVVEDTPEREAPAPADPTPAVMAPELGVIPPALAAPKARTRKIDFSRCERWDYSHEGNAVRFTAVHGTDTVAYVPGVNVSRTWRGNVWATDTGTHLHALWSHVSKLMRVQADAELHAAMAAFANASKEEEAEAKAALKRAQKFDEWVTKSRMGSDVKHTITAVRALPGVEVPAGAWDKDPYLLNCSNGTLELHPGGGVRFREHRAADRITQMTATAYGPSAKCPEWLAFLEWALPDEEIRLRFQLACSLSMLGRNFRHFFMFAIGGTRSGKSTAIEVVARVLDNALDPSVSYSGSFKMSSLRSKRESGGSPDLVRLIDRRFAFGSEPNDGWALAADVIKSLAGGDRQNIRDNWKGADGMIDREPKFVPWIIANAAPEITGSDDALFERVRVIPFDQFREEHERDETLKDRIAATEASGILNWLIEGFVILAARPTLLNRANMPDRCNEVAARMRAEADVYSRWLAECTELCECTGQGCEECVIVSESWASFRRWAKDSNEKIENQTRFSNAITAAGFPGVQKKIAGKNARRRFGLKINEEAFLADATERAEGDVERLTLIAKARGDDEMVELLESVDGL